MTTPQDSSRRLTRSSGVVIPELTPEQREGITTIYYGDLAPVKGWRLSRGSKLENWAFVPGSLAGSGVKADIVKNGIEGIHYAHYWVGLAAMIDRFGVDYAPALPAQWPNGTVPKPRQTNTTTRHVVVSPTQSRGGARGGSDDDEGRDDIDGRDDDSSDISNSSDEDGFWQHRNADGVRERIDDDEDDSEDDEDSIETVGYPQFQNNDDNEMEMNVEEEEQEQEPMAPIAVAAMEVDEQAPEAAAAALLALTSNTGGNDTGNNAVDTAQVNELVAGIAKINEQISWINNNLTEYKSAQEAEQDKENLRRAKRAFNAQLQAALDGSNQAAL